MEKDYRAGNYLRLSREDEMERDESNSITNQRMINNDWAKKHNIPVVGEYVDDGVSGSTFDRPGFKRMLEDIKAGRINMIIVKDLSRFGRNMTDTGRYLEEIFPVWGVRFVCVIDNFDSAVNVDPMASTTMAMKSLMHEFYIKDISVKIRSSFGTKMLHGEYIGNFSPYGYIRDPDNAGHLIVDPIASGVVEMIFHMRIEGMGITAITDYLNASGISCPTQRLLELGFKLSRKDLTYKWTIATVKRILEDEVYIGNMVQGKTKKLSYKSKKIKQVDRADWIRVEGTHEAIIGRQTFDFVQDINRMDISVPKGETRPRLLAGFLRCGDCGQNMISAGEGYYRCSTFARPEERHLCTNHHNSEEKLNRAVTSAVRVQVAFLNRALETIEKTGQLPKRSVMLKRVDAKIEEKLQEIGYCRDHQAINYRHLMEGISVPADYAKTEQILKDEIDSLEKDIDKLQQDRRKLVEGISFLLPWLRSVRGLGRIIKLDRKILTMLVHHIDVYEDQRVTVHFRFEEDIAELMEMGLAEEKPNVCLTISMGKIKPVVAKEVTFDGGMFTKTAAVKLAGVNG